MIFESPGIDLHIAENACGIDYADTWSSERIHWLSKSQSSSRGTTDYGFEDTLKLSCGVAQAWQLIRVIHSWVAPKSKIHWLPATFNTSRGMDHCEVCHGSIEAIWIYDPVDVKEAYRHIVPRHHSVQWHVQLHEWCDVSFGYEEDSMEGRVVLPCEVSSTEAVQILHWSHSYHGYTSRFCAYPQSFSEVVIK